VSACNACYIKENAIYRLEGGQETHVAMQDGGFALQNAQVGLSLSVGGGTGDWKIEEGMKTAFRGIVSLRREAEMPMILDGVSLTALPTDYSVESDYAWKALSRTTSRGKPSSGCLPPRTRSPSTSNSGFGHGQK
jgi:hypothetical protein